MLDWQNVDILNATKECLELRLASQTTPTLSQAVEEPPLRRKPGTPINPSIKGTPSKRAMEAEGG